MYTILFYTNNREQEVIGVRNLFKGIRKEELFPTNKIVDMAKNFHFGEEEKIAKITYDLAEVNLQHIENVLKEIMDVEKIEEMDIQVILYGISSTTADIIEYLSEEYSGIKIKLISNTYEALIYDKEERENYFKCLKLAKKGKVYKLYFMKKGIAEAYKNQGYNAGYLMQNFKLDETKKEKAKKKRSMIENARKEDTTIIGVYTSDRMWNQNIYNTLSVAKFIDNSVLRYNMSILRDFEFVNKQYINSIPIYLNPRDEKTLLTEILKTNIVLDLAFTNNFNLVTLMAMELKKPFLVGNTSDLFSDLDLDIKDIYVTGEEDNPFRNSKKVMEILERNLRDVEKIYEWKMEYNKIQKENFDNMINE